MLNSIASNAVPCNAKRSLRARFLKWRMRPLTTEQLIVLVSLYFSAASNGLLWSALVGGRDLSRAGTWLFLASVFALVTAVHCLLLGLMATRRSVKPLMTVLLMTTAAAVYYMNRYTVFFDAGMMRNVLHTDLREARELLSLPLIAALAAYGVLPALLLWNVEVAPAGGARSAMRRSAFLLAALAAMVACVALSFQDLSALMRNQKEVRYLVTPANYIVSLGRVLAAESAEARGPRLPVAPDAMLAAAWAQRGKPVLLVLVVGETARAANWGLSGYARQTTPQLAAAGVINFAQVGSCGTNTETSLPCMFSPFGRNDYDEKKIRRHESLLHVLARAGFRVIWRDNQSGCKGVCDGLEQHASDAAARSGLCDGEHCLDEALLDDLEAEVAQSRRNTVVVLHQLGNHGPAYFRRYPPAFARFAPACDSADLGKCTQQEIVNSYDNALLYTDHFLAHTIRRLTAIDGRDSAMLYVSDHGESLGENGIYLHGLPYAIAPREQKEVPMVMWLSDGFAASLNLDAHCLRGQATLPISHDHLFHSVLGMLQVATRDYDAAHDFTAACRFGAVRSAGSPVLPKPAPGPA